jgi:hypothetical protein
VSPTAPLAAVDGGLIGTTGTHAIALDGYGNKKTWSDETTEILIDDVVVEFRGIAATGAASGGPASRNGIALAPNYPNPFHPSTTIQYTLPAEGDVRLFVYNLHPSSRTTA